MRAFLALVRKESAQLFGTPIAYLAATLIALVTALIFFDHLRAYNLTLFLVTTQTTGGFDLGTIPEHVNLWDSVFSPVLDSLGLMLVGVLPLVTMRVFAEERLRGTEELLLGLGLRPWTIVAAKFVVTQLFVVLLLAVAFVYPVTAIEQGGIGFQHMTAVFLGLLALASGIASIGLACSAFSSSQLISAVSGWALAFLLWDFSWAASLFGDGAAAALEPFALHPRFAAFGEGLVDFADLAYFLGLGLVGAALARFSFDLRRAGGL